MRTEMQTSDVIKNLKKIYNSFFFSFSSESRRALEYAMMEIEKKEKRENELLPDGLIYCLKRKEEEKRGRKKGRY